MFDIADVIGGIGIILIVLGGWLIVGWPVFLLILGAVLVFSSIILGSKNASNSRKSGNSAG